jgi:sec-independent protein translocase protein TatC
MALVPFPQKSIRAEVDEPGWDSDEADDSGGKMSFLEHLDELRKRLIWSFGSLLVGIVIAAIFLTERTFPAFAIGSWEFGPWSFGIAETIIGPIRALSGPLTAIDPTETFSLYVKLVVIGGVLIASPLIMLQVWLFIAPGLYSHEKKLAIPFIALSSASLVVGAWFGHRVVFPMIWGVLAEMSNTTWIKFEPRVETTFSLYMRMVLAFAVIFQMPTIVLFLAKMGLVTARFLMRNFKYALLIIFVLAAFLTPDGSPVNQVVMAAPMVALYLFSVLLAWLFGKKRTADDL